jgi:hypothetical protein
LPFGSGVQTISGSNQIDNDPRCFKLSLQDDQFLVLYFVGAQLLMSSAITLDSYSESLQTICATKPAVGFQIPIGMNASAGDLIAFRPLMERDVPAGQLLLGQMKGRALPVASSWFSKQLMAALAELVAP